MKIQILGTGCPKCNRLADDAEAAAGELELDYELEKVTDINRIMDFGVMMTPALVINGRVESEGRLFSLEELKKILSK